MLPLKPVGRLRHELGDDFVVVPVTYYRGGSTHGHRLRPFLVKDWSFHGEREVRAIGSMRRGDRLGRDRRVVVDLERLIQRVIVSPSATSAYADSVRDLIGRAGLHLVIGSTG